MGLWLGSLNKRQYLLQQFVILGHALVIVDPPVQILPRLPLLGQLTNKVRQLFLVELLLTLEVSI